MKMLFLLIIVGVAVHGQQIPEAEYPGPPFPCQADIDAAAPEDILPECDMYGFYAPKQCSPLDNTCVCVTRCGEPLADSKGGPEIVCEELDDSPPCYLESLTIRGGPKFNKYKPSCDWDGFYLPTQCKGSVCWCVDRCGNEVESSKHPFASWGLCLCPNQDYAWKCASNPCDLESSTCPAHPDAVCKPSTCGGCITKFYVADKEVDCELPPEPEPEVVFEEPTVEEPALTCTDYRGNEHNPEDRWKMDKCIECDCRDGEAVCMTPLCAGPPMGWEYCTRRAGMEDVCCPEFDCEGCQDSEGLNHYNVGETWNGLGDPCNQCRCTDNDEVFCTRELCPAVNRYIPPLCRWVILTGECCPRDQGPDGIVCDEPISACHPGSGVTPTCPSDLCVSATCDGHPQATCKISHCGKCHTVFFDSDDVKVECGNEPVFSEPACSGTPINCLLSPCDSGACDGHPDVVCYTDYCSQCEARFFDERNTLLVCEAPVNIAAMCDETHSVGDRWEETCMYCECTEEAFIACIPHECGPPPSTLPTRCRWAKRTPGECCPTKMVCEEPLSDCPAGSTVASSCPDDLCDTTCQGHLNATCLISRCGGCSAKFFDENDEVVQCEGDPVEVDPKCDDVPQMTCILSPCQFPSCKYYPEAVCHVDYCEPCQAVYHCHYNEELDCLEKPKEDTVGMCDETHSVGDRWKDESCMNCECTEDASIACGPHDCGPPPRCRWAKRTPGKCCPSTVMCEETLSDCPAGSSVASSCPDDLCDTTCQGHLNATCLISRCGGCSAKFFDENDEVVQCEGDPVEVDPKCADVPQMTCILSPCQFPSCKYYPEAVCHVDYCEPCQAVYHSRYNEELNCLKDPDAECKDSFMKHDAGETWIEGCNQCTCEETGISFCKPTKCAIDEDNLPPLCQLVSGEGDGCCPSHVVCYEALSDCPESSSVAHSCPDDLCSNAMCDGHPDALCRISRCGGCFVKFFDEMDQVIPGCNGEPVASDIICADTGPVVTCIISPCEYSRCEGNPALPCHVDYCQPCTAVFHDKENHEHDCLPLAVPEPVCSSLEYLTTPDGTRTLPRCLKNGDYSPKQCDTAGDCWCVDSDGSMAAMQPDVIPGKDFVCESVPPCRAELKSNRYKAQRGEPVTSDPVCSSSGWFEPAQCSPITDECWCSEKDGTVVIDSVKPQGEAVKCNKQCLGNAEGIVPSVQCSSQHNGCPNNAFCHIPPNHTSGKCCYLPVIAMP